MFLNAWYFDLKNKIYFTSGKVESLSTLEMVDVVLMHCNAVNKNYQGASKVLFTFVPDKQFG